jgi:hypothetical protein
MSVGVKKKQKNRKLTPASWWCCRNAESIVRITLAFLVIEIQKEQESKTNTRANLTSSLSVSAM